MSEESVLNTYITVDTEVWCNGWDNLDHNFKDNFDQYIFGKTINGDYGLIYQLEVLKHYNLKAVFFVEPFFASRFGLHYLEEIVNIIKEYNQSVELHIHTEWVDESEYLAFPGFEKKQYMKDFTYEEQCILIHKALSILKSAGVNKVHAFRAGGFGANNDTLKALHTNNIYIDSSYNPSLSQCEIKTPKLLVQPSLVNKVTEFPMTTFIDGLNNLRHAQLTACSASEIIYSLQQAKKNQWNSYVFLSHSFELLNKRKSNISKIISRRFNKICKYLSDNKSLYRTCHFSEYENKLAEIDVSSIKTPPLLTAHRIVEQAINSL